MSLEKKSILDRLAQLDGDLLALGGPVGSFEMVIVGGSALMLTDAVPDSRFTMDIDILEASAEVEGLLSLYDMNTDVSTFLYQYPSGWRERKVRVLFDGDCLRVFTMSNEDLAVTKMLAWRNTDQQDLQHMVISGNLDLAALESILDDVTEVQINLEPKSWEDLLERFETVKKWAIA